LEDQLDFQLGKHDLYRLRINFLPPEIGENIPVMRYQFQSLATSCSTRSKRFESSALSMTRTRMAF
jgi:hypothetical protein